MSKFIYFIVALSGFASAQASSFNLDLFPKQQNSYRWIYDQPVLTDTIPEDSVTSEIEFNEYGLPLAWDYEPEIYRTLPSAAYSPVVFDTYRFVDSIPLARPDHGYLPDSRLVYGWIDDVTFHARMLNNARRHTEIFAPEAVRYLLIDLPEPPRHYNTTVDPVTTMIVLTNIEPAKVSASDATDLDLVKERHYWINTFASSLQFSQAYVSPNWYQGGNNNLNALLNILWTNKLNEKFHPNLMFETSIGYKMGMNRAEEDKIRGYSISEDLLQINSKFGVKAARRWFYSVALAFKTQLLNSYALNTNNMRASFMSPGELNVGAGMTYNYANPKKTVEFNASISPVSWNMKTCINRHMNPMAFGFKDKRRVRNDIGSSTECTFLWKITYNINYRSRLFGFTDYKDFQGDWEHTISFDINRYLTTQLYAHLRYDTQTPLVAGSDWKKFQVKEILSFGISYKFGK